MHRSFTEKGAQKEARDVRGDTPLHIAANKGHVECMNALLEAGAHKNIKNNKGYTPLDRAGGECRQILFLAGARRAITRGDFTLDELGQI